MSLWKDQKQNIIDLLRDGLETLQTSSTGFVTPFFSTQEKQKSIDAFPSTRPAGSFRDFPATASVGERSAVTGVLKVVAALGDLLPAEGRWLLGFRGVSICNIELFDLVLVSFLILSFPKSGCCCLFSSR